MRKRARRTVAELSLLPCPAAVGSPAVAHGVTPVSFCRRKMPLLRRRRILPLLLSEIRAAAVTRELLAELLPGCRRSGSEIVAVSVQPFSLGLGFISMLACRARSLRLLRFASSCCYGYRGSSLEPRLRLLVIPV
ncbi:uncharacterized protein LOC110265616 [Arachis ipaensis]|uniref:uncharacterized protein LOC110265616 n=1 Tax=Arachis ipaensis TaxID=130454 RepID=UPI000A2B5253|nr:uncharacterized protein LOC110265616 [Arachis ipaensis]